MSLNPVRKYWGVFCPLLQPHRHRGYVHEVYPLADVIIDDLRGGVRHLTPAELDQEEDRYLDEARARA